METYKKKKKTKNEVMHKNNTKEYSQSKQKSTKTN